VETRESRSDEISRERWELPSICSIIPGIGRRGRLLRRCPRFLRRRIVRGVTPMISAASATRSQADRSYVNDS